MRYRRNTLLCILFTAVLFVFTRASAPAQTAPATLEVDADHRLRMVYWDEGLFPRSGWEGWFTRHRTRAGVTWNPSSEFRLRASIANEFFSWYRHPNEPDFTLDEIFVDNLYLQWKPDNLPLEVTLGRQNMPLGEGFVVMDGGPLDGSRSIYFNALRADILPTEGHRITLFAMHQPAQDDLLPRIHDSERDLFEHDKDGAGVYYSGNVSSLDVNAYYLHAKQVGIELPDESGGPAPRVDRQLHVLGLRIFKELTEGLVLGGEIAHQNGKTEQVQTAREAFDIPLHTLAWYVYCNWSPWPKQKALPLLRAGWYQYSGGFDDLEETDHSWDPVFARWPKWSESFIYTLAQLRGSIAYWSNLSAPWLEVKWSPKRWISLRTKLQHLSEQSKGFYSSGPSDIGTLLIVEAKFQPLDRLSGHLLFERMWYAGDIPAINAEDYLWTRIELQYRWNDVLLD